MATLLLRVRHQGQPATIRGIDIESVEPSTNLSRVPGCPFHMALVRGQIIPVLLLGDPLGCLVVGRVRGEVVGIVGLDIIGFELTDAADDTRLDADARFAATGDGWSTSLPNPGNLADREWELDVEQLVARARLEQRQSY